MRLDIAYYINDNYIPYALVSLCSAIENNKGHEIHIHVVSDQIQEQNKTHIKRFLAQRYSNINVQVSYHIINDKILSSLPNSAWSKYTWIRITLPSILKDVKKVLYLDADTIICTDLSNLFSIDMSNYSIAGTVDVMTNSEEIYERLSYSSQKKYVCAGVLLMNLEKWRNENISEKIISFSQNYPQLLHYPDQDAINKICADNKLVLPLRYGVLEPFIEPSFYKTQNKDEILEAITSPAIIHYAGFAPWIKERDKHFLREYWHKYAIICNVKSKHIYINGTLSGWIKLIAYKLMRILTKIGILHFKPFWERSPKNKESIINEIKRNFQ